MTSTGEGPSTYVHIRSRMAPKAAWMSHSRTEIIEVFTVNINFIVKVVLLLYVRIALILRILLR